MSLEHKHSILDAFLAVLDEEHALAVMDHRRAIRSPLTLHAANLLAKQFARCFDPNEAADEMIMRGWRGFKPEWIRDRDMTRPPVNAVRSTGNGLVDALIGRPH